MYKHRMGKKSIKRVRMDKPSLVTYYLYDIPLMIDGISTPVAIVNVREPVLYSSGVR